MKASLILFSAAVMAAVLPATLFAQTAPVEQPVPVPRMVSYSTATTIPTTTPDPKALAARPVLVKEAVAKPAKRTAVKRPATKRTAKKTTTARKTTTRRVASATAASTSSSDLSTARSVLSSLKARYRYLDGVTVSIGKTPGGYQAVSYYTRGRILISPTHRATITRILKHEIWHIIDWRDNGKIDWRESVPPRNAADYLK